MSISVTDFLIELSENPARLREFRRAPERVALELGFGEREREVLISRDADKIRRHVAGTMHLGIGPAPIFVQSTVAHLELSTEA